MVLVFLCHRDDALSRTWKSLVVLRENFGRRKRSLKDGALDTRNKLILRRRQTIVCPAFDFSPISTAVFAAHSRPESWHRRGEVGFDPAQRRSQALRPSLGQLMTSRRTWRRRLLRPVCGSSCRVPEVRKDRRRGQNL